MLRVHSRETFTTSDGDGIRFIIFLQGCNFKCLYCSNPDTIAFEGGTMMSDEEIIEHVQKNIPYFKNGGGVTVSGGEPLLQAKELLSFCKKLKEMNINVCIDTNGGVLNDDVKALQPYVDYFLPDIKHIHEDEHKKMTGQSNEQSRKFIAYLEEIKHPYQINYILVPGYTDSEENLKATGEYLSTLQSMTRFEILPYHTLGVYKRKELGWKYDLEDVQVPSAQDVQQAEKIIAKYTDKIIITS